MKWILHIGAQNRSGILNRLTSIFAERGINLDGVLCTEGPVEPTIILTFSAPARVKDHVRRIIGRLPDVTQVREFEAGSDSVRAFALVSVRRAGLERGLLEGFKVVSETGGCVIADCVDVPSVLDRRLEALKQAGLLERVIAFSAVV